MKKRILPIVISALMLMTLIPFGMSALAEDGEYTAYIAGQVDIDVSTVVEEWGLESLPGASATVRIGEEATISMSFDEPIKFTGNWTGITIDIPVESDVHAGTTGAKITSFTVDGKDLGSKVVPLINRDGGGNLCIDIARQWGGSYDPYDLAGMDPFSSLEITFIVPNEPTNFSAYIAGQLDADVSTVVDEWGIENEPGASVDFELGQEATISMKFAEPIKFTGNWTGITTNIWVLGDDSAETTNAVITSFIVDGEDLGSREVPLISRDGGGFLCLDIARQWGGEYDPYGLIGMEPFSSLEITFVVPNEPEMIEDAPEGLPEGEFATSGNAWIGGTFLTDEGTFDWIPFEDQKVAFELGVPFTVVLDMGSGTQTHGEAEWGYITVVQTDIMDSNLFYGAYIQEILADGRSVNFDPANLEVGFDAGVRVPLTNGWAETPLVAGVNEIGEFSKLEVIMVFVEYGEESPFGDTPVVDDFEPPPSVAPIERPSDSGESSDGDGDGLPGWVIPVCIAGGAAIILAIVLIIIGNKKKNK